MMAEQLASEKTMFLEALEMESEAERGRFLDEACQGDPELRARVQALLDAHARPQPLLDVTSASDVNQVGAQIGPYKLLEQIGEGGMGIVYVAEQTEPVRRRVALKIIKPGMDTKQVIARFEAERQALAMMEHPNIAKILDAGMIGGIGNRESGVGEGRPYFVMELVRGMPITEYCDKARLNPRQRLGLFVDVCQAVQHAHQKGIIHRDLKPGNVLITLHDGTPFVKVIDFGVAKAVGQQLAEHTIYTALTQLVGTPLYMSPEQAEMSGLDVDTRCDVYSLGVLLYELLTGQTPFDKETLAKAGLDEMRRIIREDEPLRPSRRFITLGAQASSAVSQHRGLDERRLSKILRGELDWIVMKSLEKDRSRRYETASAFAADIQRYLSDEPVQARPASSVYRFRKFAQRNKVVVAAGLLIAASLLFGTAISTWQAIRATAAERQAQANLRSLQEVAREWATSETLTGDPERAEAAIRLAEAANVSKAWTEILRAKSDLDQGRIKDAIARLTPITAVRDPIGDDDMRLAALSLLAQAHHQNGDSANYVECLQRMGEFRHDPGPEAGLFKAAAEISEDPANGIASLEAASKKRVYPASLLLRAEARGNVAIYKQDYGFILQAQRDLQFAEMFAGNTPSVGRAKLGLHGDGYDVAVVVGDSQAAETHLAGIAACLPQVEQLPGSALNGVFIAGGYARLNRWDKALEVESNTDWGRGVGIQHAAAHLYERVADSREALSRFEKLHVDENNPERLIARACFCAELADKRGELPGLFQRVATDNPEAIVVRTRALVIWALLGKPVELRDEAEKILAYFGQTTAQLVARSKLQYLAGEWDEQRALKELFSAGMDQSTMQYHQSNLQYVMANKCLACGDREGARQHFEACLRVPAVEGPSRAWARAYLARMNRDPNWPDWIEKQQ